MAKTQRETRESSSTVTIILLVLLCLISGTICYFFYYAYNNLKNNVIDLSGEYTKLEDNLLKANEEYTNLLKQKDELNNIDRTIEEIKKEYYKEVVEAERKAKSGEANFKVCFMTFDDGPYLKTTPKFLDILEEKDVLATFFCLEKEACKDIYLRQKHNCHTIGNHTATHTIKYVYRNEETFVNDIIKNREYISNLLGIETNIMRFPGGSNQVTYMGLNKDSLINKLNDINYGYIDWTNETGDGKGSIPQDEEIYLHNVIDNIEGKNVITVLMHDYSNCTLSVLPELIDELEKRGYIFLPLCYECSSVLKN